MYIQHPGAGTIEFPLIRVDPADPELDLVDAARSGNRAALSELYARYSPMVNAIALAHAGPAVGRFARFRQRQTMVGPLERRLMRTMYAVLFFACSATAEPITLRIRPRRLRVA